MGAGARPLLCLPHGSWRWGGHSHLTDGELQAQEGQGSPTEPHGLEVAEGGLCQVPEALAAVTVCCPSPAARPPPSRALAVPTPMQV